MDKNIAAIKQWDKVLDKALDIYIIYFTGSFDAFSPKIWKSTWGQIYKRKIQEEKKKQEKLDKQIKKMDKNIAAIKQWDKVLRNGHWDRANSPVAKKTPGIQVWKS